MAQMDTQTIYLPNPLSDMKWPWARRMNPFYDEVKEEADYWFMSLKCFNETDIKNFIRCDFTRLAALFYPDLEREQYRLACDMFTLFFVFDEYTDVANGKKAQELADLALKPLRNPNAECPENAHALEKVALGFWRRFMAVASETCKELFIKSWQEYAEGVVQEAKDRLERTVPRGFYTGDLIRLRKLTAGVAPCIAMCFIGKECPRGFFGEPALIRLADIAVEIVCFENDTYSFQKEHATGDIHNLLQAIMHDQACSLQDALFYAEKEIKCRGAEFMVIAKTLHSEDPDVQTYIKDLGTLIIGHTLWSFETQRYFGTDHKQVEKERKLVLSAEKKRVVCW
ncbi:Terpene cyclase [Mycena venus]|uniref:Terpene synthase n=1 Tax=Mycena venus TaxID=2733690 RepID=A0A8H6YT62_9AGAR|nr:Terpene cyclase [Mycena venus]